MWFQHCYTQQHTYDINVVSALLYRTTTAHIISMWFQHCHTQQTHDQAACDPLTFPLNTECRFCCHRPACIYSIAAASTSTAPVQASTIATMAGTTTPPPMATTLKPTTPAATGKTSFTRDNRTIIIKALKPNRVQELCESRSGRPGLSVLMSLMVSVDVKQY